MYKVHIILFLNQMHMPGHTTRTFCVPVIALVFMKGKKMGQLENTESRNRNGNGNGNGKRSSSKQVIINAQKSNNAHCACVCVNRALCSASSHIP